MTDTMTKLSSLAAPTPTDMAVWDSLTDDEQRLLAYRELISEPDKPARLLTPDARYTIFSRALAHSGA